MDVYGAFQLCSIGVVAAPLTVSMRSTYYYNPAKKIMLVFTGLILAG